MYNDLYNRVKDEVVNLDKFLEKISFNHKEASDAYKEARDDSYNKSSFVESLRNQKHKMLSKNKWIADIVGYITLIGSATIFAFLIVSPLSHITNLFWGPALKGILFCAGVFGTLYITARTEYIVREIIRNKIKNTKEYKELLEEIKKAEKELELSSKIEERKHKILKWQEGICKQIAKKRDDKRAILNYLDNEINPKERTGNYSRKFKKQNKQIDNSDNFNHYIS